MNDLKQIKKLYGEKMAHLCRELFPSLLENPGILSGILEENFNPDRQLYVDIIQNNSIERFKSYLYSLVTIAEKKSRHNVKTPVDLLNEADYELYKCETVEDLMRFKPYYEPQELLCTFRDGGDGRGRLETNHIFFAVKKNVEQIKRGVNPRREDDYGVSVISIQISKQQNWLSIKNRYNHTVNNPDATFSNNLDNIIPGLTEAFNIGYGLKIDEINSNSLELPQYIRASDGRMYRYNMEINNKYYCPNNIVIDNGEVKRFDKSKTRIIDQFIINKTGDSPSIAKLDQTEEDSFIDTIGEISKIVEEKKKTKDGEEYLEITLTPKDKDKSVIIIKVDESNNIIGYENNNLTQVGNDFLMNNIGLKELNLPKLEKVGNRFLIYNKGIEELNLPNLEQVGDKFLRENNVLKELNLPNLERVGDSFLEYNETIEELNLPNLERVGDSFLEYNETIEELSLPNLMQVGDCFLRQNNGLGELKLPNLQRAGDSFLEYNESIEELYLPKIEQVGNNFLSFNNAIKKLNLPNLTQVGDNFLRFNNRIKELNLLRLEHSIKNKTQTREGESR